MKDAHIFNRTETRFSIIDRLKLLVGGVAVTNIRMRTNHEDIQVSQTEATTSVVLPSWLRKKKKYLGGVHYPSTLNPGER